MMLQNLCALFRVRVYIPAAMVGPLRVLVAEANNEGHVIAGVVAQELTYLSSRSLVVHLCVNAFFSCLNTTKRKGKDLILLAIN